MARFRLLFGISIFWLALSMLGDGLNTLVLPDYVLGFVGEARQATFLGLLTFAGLMAGMLVQPFAGLLSDRLRPMAGRRVTLGSGVLLTLGGLALFGLSPNLFTLGFAYGLIQVAANVAQAAQQGFLPDLVPAAQRGTAAGVKGLMDLGGALLGFMVLGQLLSIGQNAAALLILAGVLVALFVLTILLVHEPCPALDHRAAAPLRTLLADSFRLADVFHLSPQKHGSFVWLVASRFLFLLGTYAVGRFFLYFIADRLNLDRSQAADEAGGLLAGLTLITAVSAPLAGWAADRWGRRALMLVGAALSISGVLLLSFADNAMAILLFGGLMALGSAAFASANWALTADMAPTAEAARFFGLANFGTAGALAMAGLFGPLIDWANGVTPGSGYRVLFIGASLAFAASALAALRTRPHTHAWPAAPPTLLREPDQIALDR